MLDHKHINLFNLSTNNTNLYRGDTEFNQTYSMYKIEVSYNNDKIILFYLYCTCIRISNDIDLKHVKKKSLGWMLTRMI